MGWQLRSSCWWTVVLASLSLLLCLSSSIAVPDSLGSNNHEPSSLYAIVGSRESSGEGNSPSSLTDALQTSNEQSTLWELSISGPACDLSTPGCSGGVIIENPSHSHDDGDAVAIADGAGISQKESTKGQREVLCNVKCFRADPVCGEDAVTYWCGAAEAKCAGVEVAYTGYCDLRSGGAGKDGTRAAQSLFLVHLTWLVFAGILVIADLL